MVIMPDDQNRINLLNSLVTLGQGAIKTVMFLNGTSAVALLAFISHNLTEEKSVISIEPFIYSIGVFGLGVFLAGVATFLAYFVQLYSYNFAVGQKKKDWGKSECLRHITVVIVALSYMPFIGGIIWTLHAILNQQIP